MPLAVLCEGEGGLLELAEEAERTSPKAAALVAAQIRKQIVMGELAEGDLLPSEAEMVKRLGVSRPTLRQAFRILETEHLITVQRGSRGGTTVLRPSTKLASRYLSDFLRFQRTTIGDVLAARLMIESAAVAELAQRNDDAIVEALRAALVHQQEAEDDSSLSESAEQFHIRMVQLAGNPVLTQYCELLHYLLQDTVRKAASAHRDNGGDSQPSRGTAEAHAELVDLVAAGAAHAAVQHWRSHLIDLQGQLAHLVDLSQPLTAKSD
jgi:DNA-binding FadR family transcriptional regulator